MAVSPAGFSVSESVVLVGRRVVGRLVVWRRRLGECGVWESNWMELGLWARCICRRAATKVSTFERVFDSEEGCEGFEWVETAAEELLAAMRGTGRVCAVVWNWWWNWWWIMLGVVSAWAGTRLRTDALGARMGNGMQFL